LELKALTQDKLASLGEIATGIAHEINQPLSYIKVILQTTLEDFTSGNLESSEVTEDFQESLRQFGKITNIISHLRTFGRSDVTQFTSVKLIDVLDDALILMKERLRNRNITFTMQAAEDLPMIYGNHVKLEQVFINLIQNSMDAMEEQGKGKIVITAAAENELVLITFADTGTGIAPQLHEKIFEPFFTTKEAGKGTGIGLSIVYGIMQEHKGLITCQPAENKGTTFLLKLPVFEKDKAVYFLNT
jgi:C4-dicarboxylate-specific signal transduction histidine kinase